jgi:hypothetical protein
MALVVAAPAIVLVSGWNDDLIKNIRITRAVLDPDLVQKDLVDLGESS